LQPGRRQEHLVSAGRPGLSLAGAARLSRALAEGFERRLAEAARAAGLVSEEALAAAEAEREEEGGSLSAILVRRGLLDAAAVERLRAQVAHAEFARPATAPRGEEPPEVAAAAGEPHRRLGDFVLVAVLGRGGAGEVWRAWDRSMGRFVAVKIATAAALSTVARERFEHEVAAAARLSHPGLVPVYRSGFDDGRPYLVMPLVEGATLDGATLDARRALEVVRAAALAVAHAHEAGVIHRDLKPGNVMLGHDGRVFVLDFGLAALREEGARTTQPGDVIGTAAYMAPEQARGRGDESGPLLDVYGLGATLYFLVTGQAPYQGASFAEVVAKVGRADLVPPRRFRPAIDRSLEAVILKAMDADPRRRYATAAALAEDLRRLLDHEATSARPTGPLGRAQLALRRHPLALGGATLLTLLLCAVGIWRLRLLTERAEAVGTIREIARVSLDAALRLRRAADAVGMRQMVPRLEAAYQRARTQAPELGEVEYLMGRMYRAVLDEERALVHQDRALTKDPSLAAARYERAVLLARQYGRALDQALSWARVRAAPGPPVAEVASAAPTAPTDDAALAHLRRRILVDLNTLQRLGADDGSARAARGILAFHERDLPRARQILEEVVRVDPDREEAWEALARTLEAQDQGREAVKVYTQALARDRGYVPLLTGRCHLLVRGRDRDLGLKDAELALSIDPTNAEAHLCLGMSHLFEGHDAMMQGRSGQGLQDAIDEFTSVLERSPGLSGPLWGRGTAQRYLGAMLERRGQEPTAVLTASEADLTLAIAQWPRAADVRSSRGRTRSLRAFWRMRQGHDAEDDVAAALEDFATALRLQPKRQDPHDWGGDLHARVGRHHERQGRSGIASFEAAEAAFAHLELDDAGYMPWGSAHRGAMRTWWAEAEHRAGKDATARLAAAERDLRVAVKGLAAFPDPWLWLAELLELRARIGRRSCEEGRGRGAAARARVAASAADRVAAEEALGRARAIDPAFVAAARAP
jgi:serine/threonine-protein kinase